MNDTRFASLELLHPKAVESFHGLNKDLALAYKAGVTHTLFKPFESFRGPLRQAHVLATGASKARPWQSPHNYGLAVDFVPFIPATADWTIGEWSWASHHDYKFLAACARDNGLRAPIPWDLCHVQHPLWSQLREIVI
jgi:hypothetical protein